MNKLAKSLLIGLLEEESRVIALYGGGFKPPTKGHFEVVERTLNEHPEIDKLYIIVGSGIRNGISQDESTSIWEIYKKHLSDKIEIIKTQSPLTFIKDYLKEHTEGRIYAIVGTREGNKDDDEDFNKRKIFFEKYGTNVDVINIQTQNNISGTSAREAASESQESFNGFLPSNISKEEQDLIFDYVKSTLKEEVSLPQIKPKNPLQDHIKSLTEYMIKQNMNVKPLPKVKFINNDDGNSKDIFGKTAYYDPNERLVVLYTCNRHPKDILRSFSHEMIHHIQNIENRLEGISTQNTNEDGDLPEIEREAYELGNMTFRNWEDNIKNPKPTTSETILNEGRYDSISNAVSSDTFNKWKSDFEDGKSLGIYENEYDNGEVEFRLEANIKFVDNGGELKVDGGVYEDEDEDGYIIYIDFEIDKQGLPHMWDEISMNLKDLIRHEIEHITQSDELNFPSKWMENDSLIRNLINSKLLPTSQYFKLEKEIDANLQGLYFRAKKEKKPFIDVIENYLSTQNITPEQKLQIMDVWRTRAKSLSLPNF
jgi:phosphopantetheine adenylyltransferase